MQQPQPVCAIQRLGGNAKALEIIENVYFNALQTRLCGADIVCLDTECEMLGLN